MKKTVLMFSVLLAVICSTLAFAATGTGTSLLTGQPVAKTASEEAPVPNVGVSIGTVDAVPYSESGLNLDLFDYAEYVAEVSDGTYMGFNVYNGSWIDPETGEEISGNYADLWVISSTEEAVTIPDAIKVYGEEIPVISICGDWPLENTFASNIHYLTIPASIIQINIWYDFTWNLTDIYMLGSAPSMSGYMMDNKNIYVCNESDYASYLSNDNFRNALLCPYGWDFEWITVDVQKPGEFAETYLTQNDYSWDAVQYLKVTGNINDIDLSSIKSVSALMKLDLSETSITALPAEFMQNRKYLSEVKLPSTLESIGNYAFNGCISLASFDLNGISEIGNGVFYGCRSLSYINLNGVNTIGHSAFENCSKLNNLDLSTVKYVGENAFASCTSLESIDLSSALTIGCILSGSGYTGGGYAFANCISLKSVVLGENVEKIITGSFGSCAFETISLPSTLSEISQYLFENCENLESIEIPGSVESIGNSAFNNCNSLKEVILNNGLKTISQYAFYGCTSLEEITIPATVNTLGSQAFSNTGIKTFNCFAVVPPEATSSFIGNNMDMTHTYLYVAPFSKDYYRNTPYWSDFYLMRSLTDHFDYLLIDRPLTINLEEEDNEVVANNPTIDLRYNESYRIGQLTATGEGTLSAGELNVSAMLDTRNNSYYDHQRCPTLINYADKMRADNVSHTFSFYADYLFSSSQWRFISLPYDVKVSDIVPGENTYWVIRRYDSAARAAGETSQTWVNLTEEDTMEAGKGYIVSAVAYDEKGNQETTSLTFTSGNSITKNNIFRSTDITVTLDEYEAEFAHNRSWNLVGNPYPCYFDMHSLNEEFTAPVTIWNGRAYVAYSPVDDDLVLAPYESFFVQCPLNSNEITFKETGRMHSDEGRQMFQAPAREQATVAVEDRNVFNFLLSSENYQDRTRIVFNADAEAGYEIGRDASKFFAESDDNAQIYVNSDVAYSIDERPVADGSATLGLRSGKEGVYTLSLNGRYSTEWNVLLTDNETGVSVDLTKEDYEFTSSAADNSSRFSIRFKLATDGVDSIISDFGKDAEVTVTAINGMVVFNGRLSEIKVPASGLYLISNGTDTRKAILK
jgi:hypothetical protein